MFNVHHILYNALNIIFIVIAEVCNFLAYGYLPISLVLSLAAVTITANALLAAIFLGESLRRRDVLGVVVVVVGGFLEVNFVHDDSRWFNADALLQRACDVNFVIYVLVEIVVFVFILYLRYFVHYTDCLTSLLLVAIFGSFSVISTKAASSMANLTFRDPYNSRMLCCTLCCSSWLSVL